LDIATIVGIVLALGSIIGGQALEGGHLGSLIQLTAFVIVLGGTVGAVCVQNPLPVVLRAVSLLSLGIKDPKHDNKGTITTIIDLANVSRKQGLLALEGKLKDIHDPFFRKGVQLIVDGTDPKVVHEILEIDVEYQEEEGIKAAKVWEAAGGYSPTVGIIGAVLGLIHVMENRRRVCGHRLRGRRGQSVFSSACRQDEIQAEGRIGRALDDHYGARRIGARREPAPFAGKTRRLSAGIGTNEGREKVGIPPYPLFSYGQEETRGT
jgi:hypothetical protein